MRAFISVAAAIVMLTAVPSYAQSGITDATALASADTPSAEAQGAGPDQPPRAAMSKWWSIAMAAGYVADGATTWWAMSQSGPAVTISEGNGFYHKLFGPDVKGWEIMAFKTGQAAILGFGVHQIAKKTDGAERVIYVAALHTVLSGVVSTMNIKRGLHARRLNAAYAVQW